MADILIRGMEMPRDCPMCKLAHFNKLDEFTGCDVVPGKRYVPHSDGQFWNSAERPEWCPLLPLPEGHGDLIDRDALKKRTPMVIDYSAGGFGTTGAIHAVRGYGDWQIDQAPTIVPAEGGNADDSQL